MKALTASLVVLVACSSAGRGTTSPPHPPGSFLITAEQIEKSGAHTAWQVLRDHAPMLTMREDRNGRPAGMGRRGRSSFLLDEAPMIMLDGVRVPDFHSLETIDAASIMTILIYDGVDGTTYYGTDATSGVIVIQTKDGRQS